MTHYCHQVSGVLTRRSQADCAKQDLLGLGIRLDRVRIFDNQELVPSGRLRAKRRPFRQVIKGVAVGTLFGLLVSALLAIAMTNAGAGLFGGSPLLELLGWGAVVGGLAGAAIGASANVSQDDHPFGYTLLPGNVVLLAETHSARETLRAFEVIERAPGVGAHMDISLV